METPPDILVELMEASKAQSGRRRAKNSPEVYRQISVEQEPSRIGCFGQAFDTEEFVAVAEFKRASPSAGPIRLDRSVTEAVTAYDQGGAGAISVLAEEEQFLGGPNDVEEARAATERPILWKDFVSEPYQVLEAKDAGADAVLLIVGMLDDERLQMLNGFALTQHIDTVAEVHNEEELRRALLFRPSVYGINNRDLRTFTIDMETTLRLLDLDLIHPGVRVISESGIEVDEKSLETTVPMLEEFKEYGVRGGLIGSSLMRSDDPEGDLARFLAAVNA